MIKNETMRQVGLEVVGLTTLIGAVTVVSAYHYFDGLGFQSARAALVFSLSALFLSCAPLQLYMVLRFVRLQRANATLFEAASKDGLTQVLNRQTFRSSAEVSMLMLRQRRHQDQAASLLVIDVDHLKSINDRFGPAAGDQALKLVARTLQDNLSEDDLVGRIAGEEFAVFLRDAGAEEARIVADRLRLAVNALAVGSAAAPTRLSITLGGITFGRLLPFELLYRSAQMNLGRAKRLGRNRLELTDIVKILGTGNEMRGATGFLAKGSSADLIA